MALNEGAKSLIDILAMEYSAVRDDIIHRSSARFSMLPIGLGLFGLFAALMDINDNLATPAVWIISGIYLVVLGISWRNAGRSIAHLSNHLVRLEHRINSLAGQDLLTWEQEQQRRRTWWGRHAIGPPLPDPRTRASSDAGGDPQRSQAPSS